MAPDDGKKTWGTIYLGARRESTVDKLDAMQAAVRQEQWNQRTQDAYMERVRDKATERAKEILGAAYAERQKILDEAHEEARRIQQDAQATLTNAANIQASAEQLQLAAQQKKDAAEEEGFHAGLDRAQEELEQFRAAMGTSVAGVLGAIRSQCGVIFEGWRQDMVELLKVCVEKGTGLVLEERHARVLEQMVMTAVRQLDDRRTITLRVHPEDEAAVADMVAAAKERIPNIGQWIVSGDAALEPGGLVAESQGGTVDSRLELHRELVENILQHLTLPSSGLDSDAAQAVDAAMLQEVEGIAALAPPAQQDALPSESSGPAAIEELSSQPSPPPSPTPMAGQPEEQPAAAEPLLPPLPEAAIDVPSPITQESPLPLPQENAEEELADAAAISPDAPAFSTPVTAAAHEPTRQELEEELLPLPPEQPVNAPHVDKVLAQGGFLDGNSLEDSEK